MSHTWPIQDEVALSIPDTSVLGELALAALRTLSEQQAKVHKKASTTSLQDYRSGVRCYASLWPLTYVDLMQEAGTLEQSKQKKAVHSLVDSTAAACNGDKCFWD